MSSGGPTPLLLVEDLVVEFHGPGGQPFRAVDGVSLQLEQGKTLGVVGESGSGKSTLARTVLRLIPATSGRVQFEGRDLLALDGRELRPLRKRMQMVFQDPAGSLNPRLTIQSIVAEGLRAHRLTEHRRDERARVAGLLERVGLRADDQDRYPHEFSGGQRQRIGIARCLAVEPELIVCDEPVSALDVSIQSQILNLLADLQDEYGLSYLFISHDLAVVRHVCDEVVVMRRGKIVERGDCLGVIENPQHEYTQTLLAAARGGQRDKV